jgi:hypothetical protein
VRVERISRRLKKRRQKSGQKNARVSILKIYLFVIKIPALY